MLAQNAIVSATVLAFFQMYYFGKINVELTAVILIVLLTLSSVRITIEFD